jgi:hypothetical protein
MTQASADVPAFDSRLTDGTERFLAHMIEHAFTIGRRSSRDFLRHFPPSTIMEALRDNPSLRADILEAATGVKRKVALKKSASSSGEDLQIALDEGEAAADEVVRLFRPDDRVRYLPRAKLWSFVTEGEFWKVNKNEKGNYDRAQAHLAFLLDRALKDLVINHQDVIDGISVAKLCLLMPRPELETAMNSALSLGRKGQPFSDRDLYEGLSSISIVNYIPLTHVWEEVVHPFIAVEHGLCEAQSAARVERVEKTPAPTQEELPRQSSANTNDQLAVEARGGAREQNPAAQAQKDAPAQLRPAPAKAMSPMVPAKRPHNLANAMAAAMKPATAKTATAEPLSEDEDGAFDVHFDNLTASKT